VLVTASDLVDLRITAKRGGRLTGRVLLEGGSLSRAERAALRITAVAVFPQSGAPPDIATIAVV